MKHGVRQPEIQFSTTARLEPLTARRGAKHIGMLDGLPLTGYLKRPDWSMRRGSTLRCHQREFRQAVPARLSPVASE